MAVLLFLLQLAATLFMTGLIWFVQIVHYPLFAEVGPGCLPRYETLHANRTSWVVFPPMLLELLTAASWLYPLWRPSSASATTAWLLAVLVGIIWATTGFCHVPLHTQLGNPTSEPTKKLLHLLVAWNWLRTAAWTARSLLLLSLLRRTL